SIFFACVARASCSTTRWIACRIVVEKSSFFTSSKSSASAKSPPCSRFPWGRPRAVFEQQEKPSSAIWRDTRAPNKRDDPMIEPTPNVDPQLLADMREAARLDELDEARQQRIVSSVMKGVAGR